MSVGESSESMSLEEARPWQVKANHSAVARGHMELARSSRRVACVWLCQMKPFVKQPDPLGTRKQGAAQSEKQMSLRSNVEQVSKRECSRRTDDTGAWNAEPT